MSSEIHKEFGLNSEKKENGFSRREALKGAVTGLVATLPVTQALAKAASSKTEKKPLYTFLQKNEVAFLEAAVSRLIPADEQWPGALEAGVVNYFDLQLGGSWGAGERLYRSGPWFEGTKTQGYQLPFTPAEFFRTGIRAIDQDLKAQDTTFADLPPEKQDAYLKDLEKSTKDLDGIPAKLFFATLLQMTFEGYLADPSYGGNKEMVSWKMIGFPGAFASYYDLVDQHGIQIKRKPLSLAEDSMGRVHPHPQTPAR